MSMNALRHRRRGVGLAVAAHALVGVDADDERVLRAVGAQLDLGQPQDDRLDVRDPHLGADHARPATRGLQPARLTPPSPLRLTPRSVAAIDGAAIPARHCMHPREHRLTRRNLMRGALGAGAVVGVAGVAAGCQNTTTAIGSGEGGGNRRGAEARRPASRPARTACRCRAPTTASPGRSPTTTRRSRTASSPRAARCSVYNYADYIWPGLVKRFEKQFDCKVKIATYNSADEAAAKLAAGARRLRRRHRASAPTTW